MFRTKNWFRSAKLCDFKILILLKKFNFQSKPEVLPIRGVFKSKNKKIRIVLGPLIPTNRIYIWYKLVESDSALKLVENYYNNKYKNTYIVWYILYWVGIRICLGLVFSTYLSWILLIVLYWVTFFMFNISILLLYTLIIHIKPEYVPNHKYKKHL